MATEANPGELLFTLTDRERALIAPELQVIANAESTIRGAQGVIARMLQLRAGRDDVSLHMATGEVRVVAQAETPGEPQPRAEVVRAMAANGNGMGPHGVATAARVDDDDGN